MKIKTVWRENTKTKTAYLHYSHEGVRYKKRTIISIPISKKITSLEKNELELIKIKLINNVLNGNVLSGKDVKIIDLLDEFIATSKLKSIRKYMSTRIHVSEYMPEMTAKKLTRSKFQDFIEYLYAKKFSYHTVYSYAQSTKRILNIAVDRKIIKVAPKVKLRAIDNELTKNVTTPEEIEILKKTPIHNQQVKNAYLFATYTGVGRSELIKLRRDVNINGDYLEFVRSKSRVFVKVKLHDYIKSMLPKLGEDYLFPNMMSEVGFKKAMKVWLKRAGINKEITFYCGRHSFGVRLALAGIDARRVQKLMGHKDIQSTMVYFKYMDSLTDDAIDSLV